VRPIWSASTSLRQTTAIRRYSQHIATGATSGPTKQQVQFIGRQAFEKNDEYKPIQDLSQPGARISARNSAGQSATLRHARKVIWSEVLMDQIQGQDLILRMMGWGHAPLVRHRVDATVLTGSNASLAPIPLHHPEEHVVGITPNTCHLGSAATYSGTVFARNIGARLQ
jgi:hypothetical protein